MAVDLFTFEHVTVRLGDATVLDDVSAAVPPGKLVVIAGASGSGKSTMLRCCNRLEAPTSGVVRLEGTDVCSLDVCDVRRRVGMVFQQPTPFPGTVAENLRVGAPELTDAEAGDLLSAVGLDASFLDREATTLSGGEAQRMCVARALATRPGVLLMDEPTSALDDENTRGLESLARELVDDGTSILWVTHDTAQIDRIADQVVRVADGRVVE